MKERTEGEAKASLMPCYSGIRDFIVSTLGVRSEFRQTNSPSLGLRFYLDAVQPFRYACQRLTTIRSQAEVNGIGGASCPEPRIAERSKHADHLEGCGRRSNSQTPKPGNSVDEKRVGDDWQWSNVHLSR